MLLICSLQSGVAVQWLWLQQVNSSEHADEFLLSRWCSDRTSCCGNVIKIRTLIDAKWLFHRNFAIKLDLKSSHVLGRIGFREYLLGRFDWKLVQWLKGRRPCRHDHTVESLSWHSDVYHKWFVGLPVELGTKLSKSCKYSIQPHFTKKEEWSILSSPTDTT